MHKHLEANSQTQQDKGRVERLKTPEKAKQSLIPR